VNEQNRGVSRARTDRPTDRPIDRPTDRPTDRPIDRKVDSTLRVPTMNYARALHGYLAPASGEHLPISGNMLGWSSSDLRLFSTRVGEERSLSLISRTAPRSLQARTTDLLQHTRGNTLDSTHRARVEINR